MLKHQVKYDRQNQRRGDRRTHRFTYPDGAVTNKEDFIRDVWLREELGSTGFENHIAIPHGKSSGVSRTALAIGRTQHAIPGRPWMAATSAVYFICGLPVDQNATHIRLLAQVSGSLADEDIIAKLLVESDPHKIIALFNSETENADA